MSAIIISTQTSLLFELGIYLPHKQFNKWLTPNWPLKNWCFWIVVLEEALESPLDCKEIKPINSEGKQPWVLTGRTDPEVEAPVLWPSHEKRRLPGKDPDVGKVWRQEEKGTTEDEMAGQCHRSYHMNLTQLQEAVEDRWAWRALIHGVTKSRTLLNDWTTTKCGDGI